jgi:hypothetical protein
MAVRAALKKLCGERFFDGWDEFLSPERVRASEDSVRRLVDDLLALGPEPDERAARSAVDACVRRFNDLDDGWICTIEREDICEQVGRAVEAAGFECDEDWLGERDW